MLGGYGRTAAALCYPVSGFLAIVLLWSLFVGDFRHGRPMPLLPLPQDTIEDGLNASPIWPGWQGITDMFVFGDSYSSTYFNPEGAQPTGENPFGNSDFLGGFSSGEGPKWVQYMKVMYKAQSLFRVYNFGVYGAIVDRHAYDPRPQGIGPSSECVSLKEQVRCWIKNYCPEEWRNEVRVWNANSTLFALWFGVHDMVQALEKNLPIAADPIFGSYSSSFERMYKEGARNFLILNTPVIDRGLGDPTGKIKLDIWTYNQRLEQTRAKWIARHHDATIFLFDAHKLTTDILETPMNFPQTTGLQELRRYCRAYEMGAPTLDFKSPECDFQRDLYFWLNPLHITHPIHDAIASRINSDCFASGGPVGYCK